MTVTYFVLLGCVFSHGLACTLPCGDTTDAPADCLYEGQIYAHGDPIDSGDPCTFGECWLGEVRWLVADCAPPMCDEPLFVGGQCCPVCEAMLPPLPTMPPLCYDERGWEYSEGQAMDDPCGYCECSAGQKTCYQAFEHECPSVELCTSPVTLPGSCCPSCPEGCFHFQKWFDNGAVVNDNPCIPCVCTAGQVECTIHPCVSGGPPPFDIPA